MQTEFALIYRPQDILAAAAPATSPSLSWDANVTEAKEDPVQTQTQHKKVARKPVQNKLATQAPFCMLEGHFDIWS